MPKGATEVPTPQNPPAAVVPTGGSIYDSSAGDAVDASADGALSGPFMIYTQGMHVFGSRLGIKGARNTDASSFSLSAQSESYFVQGTHLVSKIIVITSKQKSYENYATSSFYQPQKFTLYPGLLDGHGNIYNTPVGYQFGPQFSIHTTQAAIRRELWDDNNPNHVESDSVKAMWTGAAAKWDAGAWIWNHNHCNQEPNRDKLSTMWANPEDAHSYTEAYGQNSVSWREVIGGPVGKYIQGPYNTEVEVSALSNLQGFVDYIGQQVRENSTSTATGTPRCIFFKSAADMGSSHNGQTTLPGPADAHYEDFHADASPLYDWTLHDWS